MHRASRPSDSRPRDWCPSSVDLRPSYPACAVYCHWRHVAIENLAKVVQSLTPQEQEAVLRFIDYLKGRGPLANAQSPFLQAADEFIADHPDLLHHLAR